MKNNIFILSLTAAVFSCACIAPAEEMPSELQVYDIDKIIGTDLAKISEVQFYDYELAVIGGSSGSGGYFLGETEIAWLKKAETAFLARGIKLKDEYGRGNVYADSYFHLGEHEKAIQEYRHAANLVGAESVEWVLNNKGVENGTLKIVEYPGNIPGDISDEAKAEDDRYLFVSFWRGAVYRYDKLNDKRAVIFSSADEYDWVDSLAWDGQRLTIDRRDGADTFVFENATNILSKKTVG